MDEMEQLQIKHVDKVNKEFREDLKTLNLQFIGRGKHLRKAQKDIVDNTKLINHVTDSLGRNIETVALDLENFQQIGPLASICTVYRYKWLGSAIL